MTGLPVELPWHDDLSGRAAGGERTGRFSLLMLTVVCVMTMISPVIVVRAYLPTLKLEDPILVLMLIYLVARRHPAGGGALWGRAIRPFSLPLAILVVWLFLVELFAGFPVVDISRAVGAFSAVLSTMKAFVLAVVIVGFVKDLRALRVLTWVVLLMLVFEVAVLYAQYNNLFGVHAWLTPFYRRFQAERFAAAGGRTAGTYGNPNVAGVAVAVMSGAAVATAVFGKGIVRRLLAFAAAGAATVVVTRYTGSRTALACCLIAFAMPVLLALLRKGFRGRGVVLGTCLLALGVVGAAILEGSELFERFSVFFLGGVLEERSLLARIINWQQLIAQVNPYLVTGLGTMEIGGVVTDSGYVSLIFKGGLIALSLFIWFLAWPAKAIFGERRPNDMPIRDIVIAASITGIAIVTVSSLTLSAYTNNRLFATVAIVTAMGLALRKIRLLSPEVDTDSWDDAGEPDEDEGEAAELSA